MSILKHFLFFKLESNLEFNKFKDSFCIIDDGLYKIDVVDNELFFLQANKGLKDIDYLSSSLKFNDIKSKSLKYKRAVVKGQMIEQFANFYICTNLDNNYCEGLCFDEYERLKLSLVYGLKAKDLGISIELALRIYLFYLSLTFKNNEIKDLLNAFSFIYDESIISTITNNNDDFLQNLSCIVLDNDSFYTNDCAKQSFSKIYSKVLRIYAIECEKTNDIRMLVILLDFLEFFKKHKKLALQDKLKKSKNTKKIAKKISKIAKNHYIG